MRNPKFLDKSFQAEALKWWRTLSINEQKALHTKYNALLFSQILPHEIARIYDAENPGNTNIYNKLMAEAVFTGRNDYGEFGLGCIVYLFDGDKNEIGYYPKNFPNFAIEMRNRVWNSEWKESLVYTKLK